ncbi:MAG: transketolase C-terminal domain-containing protein [Planctomycetota bacterium]|nr:transketolase C-terminal domain-containing protein [Planctomycetota bacterium]
MNIGQMIAPRLAYGEALAELVVQDDRVVVLDADVATSTQTAKVRKVRPESFYEIGIAEQNMMCIAAGMSTLGLIPYACTFAVFASKRACDQVSISIAYPRLNVKVSGAYGGIPTGKAGATHQAIEDIAIMRAMPNMTILVPADATETKQAVLAAHKLDGPVYIRTIRCPVPVLFDEKHKFEIGKAVTIRQGQDVTIISTGLMTAKAQQAGELLAGEGIQARVLHVHTIKPLDEQAILSAASETAGIVTAENHNVIGGLGSAVAELLCERHPARVKRIGLPDCFGESGDNEKIFTKLKMNTEDIVAAAKRMLQ